MEVQHHGNYFEDIKTKELTGLPKTEYDKLKQNGYTSTHDLVEGVVVDFNGSIKTTNNNSIDCGDALRRYDSDDYLMIVGVYNQEGDTKVFHTEYTFHIDSSLHQLLWGDITREELVEFINFVKTIPHGRQAQQETKQQRDDLKRSLQRRSGLFTINPKVDSKTQRRVQCTLHISKLIQSGVRYSVKDIHLECQSGRRQFN